MNDIRARARSYMREASEIIDRINKPATELDALEARVVGHLTFIFAMAVFAFALVAAVVVEKLG
jgi:hypothetical protein